MFQPFTSRIWKKQVISTCEKSHHRLAYAHCATGEAKAKSTGAAYEEVKVAKDQLNMAFVEKKPKDRPTVTVFFEKYMATHDFFCKIENKRVWQYLF